ncbi:hypothetical protein [Paracoccus sp. TOH]|uniref:Uncharacterized protein n=1 Tax=Paracoccus simplex TaxID=2086346 RepID=A0ABV7S4E6_9RHOB|nr:hypothetical protein [Paracoccus sp. TOH]WJS84957.1 hypothetical protein NBE95_04030 [Paracoccus sp. TOH]
MAAAGFGLLACLVAPILLLRLMPGLRSLLAGGAGLLLFCAWLYARMGGGKGLEGESIIVLIVGTVLAGTVIGFVARVITLLRRDDS